MGTRPTVISTFAGCGGSSLGYRMAGFDELLAIDFDENCEKTFKLNFPETPFWKRNIKEVSTKEIMEFTKIKTGDLDVLDGSPPCQGFSVAGKRKVGDERNNLFFEFIRLIGGLQPKVFVAENVMGMMFGKMRGIYNKVMTKFLELPYKISCKVVNSQYYKVPQARKRLVWIGVRKDIGVNPMFPKPNNSMVTVGMALKEIKSIEQFAPKMKGEDEVFPFVKTGPKGSRAIPQSLLLKYAPRLVRNKKLTFKPCHRLDAKNVSPTIVATNHPYSNTFLHPTENRQVSIEELLVIQSFPPSFKLSGDFQEKRRQIGNSVPPKMMKAIADTIKKEILGYN